EELDAVVLKWVVGGGEHDATVGVQGSGQQRDPRRGKHADRVTVGAGGEEAGHHRGLEQRPRAPRVADDHQPNARPAGLLARPGPVTSTGAVSTVARSSIVVRGPFTWTVAGSTTTRPSWTSAGGEPRSRGTTRSARVAAVATATRTQFGDTRTTLTPAGACTS